MDAPRGRGVFLASAAFIVACGDGGGPSGPGDDNGNPSGTAVTVEERMVALDAAETLLEALLGSGVKGDDLNAALATALKGLPVIAATGVDTATSMAWARFTDGRLLIIGDNRPAGPVDDSVQAAPAVKAVAAGRAGRVEGARGSAASPASRAGHAERARVASAMNEATAAPPVFAADGEVSELPTSRHVRLLHSFGPDFDQLQRPIEDMAEWFEEHGYQVRKGWEGDARVATLRNISGDGFFYFNTHGGGGHDRTGRKLYAMGSSTLATVAHDDIHAFIFEMHRAGAGVYFGWSGTVTATGGFRAVRYFVDRLLGANEFQPESPMQRPFTWPLVLQDMASKGYTTDGEAQLVARPATQSGARVGILRPSIGALWVAPPFMNSDLYIEGYFGTRPGRVTIDDGSGPGELAIKDWTPAGITAGLPLTGTGSIGDVAVHVGDDASNPRRLHRYTGTAFYRLTDAGSLMKTAEMELNTRLDPDEMRFAPGETPSRLPDRGAGHASPTAEARFEARGSHTRQSGECTVTDSYSGGGSVPAGTSGTPGYTHALWMDGSGQMAFEIAFGATANRQTQTVCDDGTTTRNATLSIAIDAELRDANWFMLQTTPQMHAVGDSRTVQVRSNVGADQATARLWWTDIVPTPAYDPAQAK